MTQKVIFVFNAHLKKMFKLKAATSNFTLIADGVNTHFGKSYSVQHYQQTACKLKFIEPLWPSSFERLGDKE